MSERRELELVSEAVANSEIEDDGRPAKLNPGTVDHRRARAIQALQLRLAGMTYQQIGERMGVSHTRAVQLVKRVLSEAEAQGVEEMRAIENERLDRLQLSMWNRALRGEDAAVDRVLKISERRARMNGLDAPQKVDLSVSVRQEMEQALTELEQVVLEGEVIEDAETDDDDADE